MEGNPLPVSDWIIAHSTLLCSSVYETDPSRYVQESLFKHDFTSISVSHKEGFAGRFLVAEAYAPLEDEQNGGTHYFFMCFCGSENVEDWLTNIEITPKFETFGIVHTGFLDRIKNLPLSPLIEASVTKKVVLTGHSLGGACANLLACHFFSASHMAGFDSSRFYCITFGSPLVGGLALQEYMFPYKEFFHHFIMPNDVVPLALTLVKSLLDTVTKRAEAAVATWALEHPELQALSTNTGENADEASVLSWNWMSQTVETVFSFKPFGNFYQIQQQNKVIEMLTNAQVVEYFDRPSATPPRGDLAYIAHNMITYSRHLSNCRELPMLTQVIDRDWPSGISYQPDVKSCFIRNHTNTVIIRGVHLGFIKSCTLTDFNGSAHVLTFQTDAVRQLCFELPPQVCAALCSGSEQQNRITLRVATYFVGYHALENSVPFQMSPEDAIVTPYDVLTNVCPLVTILVNSDHEQHRASRILQEMYKHCKDIADSIPVDFAFRILQYDQTRRNLPIVNSFLNRLGQVNFDYEELSTSIMINSLRSVLKKLSEGVFDVDVMTEQCSKYIYAFGNVLTEQSAPVNNLCKILIPNEIFFYDNCNREVNQLASQQSEDTFWKSICEKSISIILDFSEHTDKLHAKPGYIRSVVGRRVEGYDVMPKEDSQIYLYTEEGVTKGVVQEYTVSHGFFNEKFTLTYISIEWNEAIPPIAAYEAILHKYKALKSSSGHPTYIRDSGQGAAATFLLTRVLSCTDHVYDDQMRPELHSRAQYPRPQYNSYFRRILSKMGSSLSYQQCQFADFFAHMSEFHFQSKSATGIVEEVLQGLLSHLKRLRKYGDGAKFCSDVAITVSYEELATHTQAPFLALFEQPISVSEVANADAANSDMVHGLMTRAKRAHVNSCMIGTIIEDIMGFSECCLEVERDDSTFLWMCRNVVSGLQQVTMVPAYGVYKLSLDAALDYSEDIWRSVNYERTPYSSYAEMVQLLYDRIGMVRDHATTIMEMERDIDRHIPSAVRCETLTNIMRNVAAYFHRSVFEELVKGKSSGLVIVYLKIIHHSRALRMLRDSVTVVTVGGENNAGKTDLMTVLFGDDCVIGTPGITDENRTIMPIAYYKKNDPTTLHCDLPGCTDQDRVEMSKMFTKLGDVVVFVVNATTPENSTDESLEALIAYLVTDCQCPRLICINQCDRMFESTRKRHLCPEVTVTNILTRAAQQWRQKTSFAGIMSAADDTETRTAHWDFESPKTHAIVASIKSPSTSISIWLTCFNSFKGARTTGHTEEFLERVLFSPSDVEMWINANKKSAL